MPNHDYTFGARNESGQSGEFFDVFAKVRDKQSSQSGTSIVLMSMTQEVAERIIAIMLEKGLLVKFEGDTERMYILTDKGRQLGQETKRQWLEEQEQAL